MRTAVASSSSSYSLEQVALLLEKCCTMNHLLQLQTLVVKSSFATDSFIRLYAKLLTLAALRSWGCLHHARCLFSAAPPSALPLLCDPMIRAFSRSIFPLAALPVYSLMCRRRIPPSPFTFPFLLKACSRAASSLFSHSASAIHSRILRLGFDSDPFVRNSLMTLYSQFGIRDARKLFDEMSQKTIVSWNVMLAAYLRIGDLSASDELFRLMPQKNVSSWNSMITRYVRAGDMASASRVFREMPQKDAVSWNSMISGYIREKNYGRALDLFKQMQSINVKPTEMTVVSVLAACAETGQLDLGREVHFYVWKNDYRIEGYVGNALLDMYAKCGSLNMAWKLFDEMRLKHVTSWNAMIVALAVHGQSEEALNLFASMERETSHEGTRPNHVTFVGVLIACRHKGLVKEGQVYFKRMIEEYKIEPNLKHFGCMADLLSRCGLIQEAYQMIKEMPVKANAVLWKTVLSACKVYGNVELAESAYTELAKLGAPSEAEYVIMSNIYANAGRWADVGRLRTGLVGCSIAKPPGCSTIELI
ncbi:pentatricopeptide repeat-containing protein At5g15300-like [Zingiber officinale]|uniref:Pentatricopeptide repeat-containing protein n=1 Tax=Zingiber officinale TaxID=94328 RepID=A0A8J5L0B0_ZINOF|nr:pentatricopeptide repeat-containing protein At5g15300-like [Zingiber officinale]KAG6496616.1 hypothetical protein ZIOFF_044486 [Zingiber officinale]